MSTQDDRDVRFNPDTSMERQSQGTPATEGGAQGAADRARELAESGRERAAEAVERGREQAAGTMDRIGETLHERAERMESQGGLRGRAASAAHRAADTAESGAEYVRTADASRVRSDLEQQIRDNPFLSMGIALGAGFVLGRLLD
jgi:ElaB/YqjD/DUF883 family membrane-anchored ribosome-binding protein